MRVREFVCAVGAMLLVPALGFACSVGICAEHLKLSAQGLTIPANAPAIIIDTLGGDPQGAVVELKTGGGELVEARVERMSNWWKIESTEGFGENESYTLEITPRDGTSDLATCGLGSGVYEFATGSIAELPTILGNLTSSEVKQAPIEIEVGAPCSEVIEMAYVDLELELPEEAAIWRGALMIETLVDGMPWKPSASFGKLYTPGESWVGFAKDRVFILCDSSDYDPRLVAAEGGVFDVQMRATIAGTELELESETISIELRCDLNAEPEPNDSCAKCDDVVDPGCATTSGGSMWLAFGLVLFGVRRRRTHQF